MFNVCCNCFALDTVKISSPIGVVLSRTAYHCKNRKVVAVQKGATPIGENEKTTTRFFCIYI